MKGKTQTTNSKSKGFSPAFRNPTASKLKGQKITGKLEPARNARTDLDIFIILIIDKKILPSSWLPKDDGQDPKYQLIGFQPSWNDEMRV